MTSSTTRFALAVATASLLGSYACAAPEEMQPETPSTTTITSAPAPRADAPPEGAVGTSTVAAPAPLPTATDPFALNDAQILTAMKAVSRTVLEQARTAVKEGHSERVRQLAEDLLETHASVGSRIDAVLAKERLAPEESAASDDAKRRGESVMAQLRASHGGSSFDRSYVDGQVAEQEDLLGLIDRSATRALSQGVRDLLDELRTSIARGQRDAAEVRVELTP